MAVVKEVGRLAVSAKLRPWTRLIVPIEVTPVSKFGYAAVAKYTYADVVPSKDELRMLDRSACPPTTRVPELSKATVKFRLRLPPVGTSICTSAVPCAANPEAEEYVTVTSKLWSETVEPRDIEPRSEVSSRVPEVPAERSIQPAAVSVADTLGVVRARLPLTVRYQSLELVNEQPVGVATVPLLMVTLTPDRVRTDGMMLTGAD
jgi:hypothetical protein